MNSISRAKWLALAAGLMLLCVCTQSRGPALAAGTHGQVAAPGPTTTLDATARGFARAVIRYTGKDATILSYLTPGLAARASHGRIFTLMGMSNNPAAYKLTGMAGGGRFARLTITWVLKSSGGVTGRVVDHTIWVHTGFGWRLNAVSHGR